MIEPIAKQSRDTTNQEQSFPLVSVVQLITFSAALFICIDFKLFRQRLGNVRGLSSEEMIFSAGLVILAGFAIGAAIGLGQIRQWRSMMICGAVGAFVSALIMATYIAPANPAKAVAATLIPLITTIALRARTP